MSIECGKFDAIWDKAVRNVGAGNLTSTYSWSDGVASVVRLDEDGTSREIANGETQAAVFFDNAEYPIWVDFKSYVRNARFGSTTYKVTMRTSVSAEAFLQDSSTTATT